MDDNPFKTEWDIENRFKQDKVELKPCLVTLDFIKTTPWNII